MTAKQVTLLILNVALSEVEQEYIVTFDFTLGTSVSGTIEIVSGVVLDTVTLTATGSSQLRFVANSDNATFKITNDSAVTTEDSLISELFYFDIATGSRVGIQLDDGTRQWTNCIDKDDVSDPPTVTISNDLTGDSETSNIAYAYGDLIDRPLRIYNARFASDVLSSEIPTNKWSRDEYFDQPDKTSKGTCTQWYYTPQLTNGDLFVWQTAFNVNNVLRFTYERPLEISVEFADETDIPAEWVEPLVWNLAKELAIEFPIPDGRYARVDERATNTLNAALDFDTEDTYLWLQIDRGH